MIKTQYGVNNEGLYSPALYKNKIYPSILKRSIFDLNRVHQGHSGTRSFGPSPYLCRYA